MINLEKIEKFFEKKRNIVLLFAFLILAQFIYSFLSPAYEPDDSYWKNFRELGSYKSYSYDSFDNSILGKIYPLISDYHVSLDAAAQILLAHDFPQAYFRGIHTFLNRPLYAFLVFLIVQPLHLVSNSLALTFFAGLFVNFLLFFFMLFIFYLLVKKTISHRVAFLSSILLIFSPFAHIWLVQPSTDVFGAFSVILVLYLFYNYVISPNLKKLIIFSFIIGLLMLGKMIFALPFFVLAFAVIFKRHREGFLFGLFFLIPLIFWYLIVTKIFGMAYYSGEMTDFSIYLINGWFFKIFEVPWYQTFKTFLDALPSFIFSLVYGFLLLPVIFALIGFKDLALEKKNIFYSIFISSFFLLFFFMNYYIPRHGFLLFPVIYPAAVLGIDKAVHFLKRYFSLSKSGNSASPFDRIKRWLPSVFYLSIYIFLIIISNLNIFYIFEYDDSSPWFR